MNKDDKKFEYRILRSWNNGELERIVLRALEAGYKLQGGVSVAVMPNGNEYWAQAVIKEVSSNG